MEYDMSEDFAQFIIDAINSHLEAFPEFQEEANYFMQLMVGCFTFKDTLHINY